MRLATFKAKDRTSYGAVTGDGIIDLGRKLGGKYPTLLDLLRAGAVGEAKAAATGQPDYNTGEVEFQIPLIPEKIICVGINYPERTAEYKDNRPTPKYPNLFVRFPSSFVGHEQALVRPKASEQFDYEGEVVVVIGREGRHVPQDRALDMIGGFTLSNEGTLRDWVRHGTLNITQGKNFDKSGSMGPWIVTSDELDPKTPLHLMTRVNGELRQDDTTDRLTWGFAWLINYISTFTTLRPGDLILTGTPTGAGSHANPPKWLQPGDILEIEVPQIGVLRNGVMDEK